MSFKLTLDVEIGADTEGDFYNEIVAQNAGEAIQELANGNAIEFANVTAEQKKNFVLKKLSEQFANIYNNSKLEREVQVFRAQKIAERSVTK